MKRSRIPTGLAVTLAAAAAACTGLPPAAASATVRVAKSLGSRQCQPGGADPAALARQLSDAGLRVVGSSCGSDGRMYPAVCGAGDGRIAIVEIAADDQPAAERLGFAALSTLPDARAVPCR